MKIAVIENQDETATAMKKILKRGGYEVTLFTGNEDTGSIVTEIQKNNLAILDIELEKESGIHILKKLRKVDRSFPVILIMACLSPESIIEASQFGVREMLQKPLDYEELLNTVRKCDMLSRDVVDTTEGLDGDNFIGSYKTMGDIYRKIGIAAANGLNVMLIGETGVGKELVARQIHAFSD
ncbi:MAG: response regulator, partial [bacterium]